MPTVNQLVNELDKFPKEEGDAKSNASVIQDYDKTSLKGPLKVFESFLKNLE